MLVSELAGRASMLEKAAELGIELDDATAARVIGRVKELEHEGYQFEAADGSLELLLRRETGGYEPLFTLESWRVIVEQRADGAVQTEATIKIWIDGERRVQIAEGNGPVNALDRALRAAIGEVHPHLADIELVNFKVRILDEDKGTGAVTRVLLDASDGARVWGSIGVSENVVAASWKALVDSLERGMLHGPPASTCARRSRSRSRSSATAEEEAVLAVLRSGRLSLGPLLGEFEQRFAAASARRFASAVSSGTAGLHLALRAVGVRDGDEVDHEPVLVRRLGERDRLRARAARVRRYRPAHADDRPGRRGRGGRPAHAGAAAGPHLRLAGRRAGARAARAADRRGRLRGARRALRRRRRGRRARPPGRVRLLRQQAADDRRGRDGDARATRR